MITKEQAIQLLKKTLAEMTEAEKKLLPEALKLVSTLQKPVS